MVVAGIVLIVVFILILIGIGLLWAFKSDSNIAKNKELESKLHLAETALREIYARPEAAQTIAFDAFQELNNASKHKQIEN